LVFNPSGDTNAGDAAMFLNRTITAQTSPVSVFVVWKLLNTSFLDASAILRADPSSQSGFALRMQSNKLIYRDYNGTSSVDVDMTAALGAATGPMLSEVTESATGAITTWLNGG